MHHDRWDYNVLRRGFFEEFADEINAEIAKNVSKSVSETKREFAKKLKARKRPIEEIVEDTGLSEDEVKSL
jgi:hypothetical protein